MSEAPSRPANQRPVIITVICVIGIIGALLGLPIIFTGYASEVGAWYPPFLGAACIVGLISFIGLWWMRLWSIYLYLAMFIINQIVLIVTHYWAIAGMIIPLIVLIVGFSFRSRMR